MPRDSEYQRVSKNEAFGFQTSEASSKNTLVIKASGVITDIDNRGLFGNQYQKEIELDSSIDKYFQYLTIDVIATDTIITVADTTGLLVGNTLTIQDNAPNKEEVVIVSVDSPTQITVTALVNGYTQANNSVIYRSFEQLIIPTLINGVANGGVNDTKTNVTNTWFGMNPDGLLDLNNGIYDATQLVLSIVNTHKYFIYLKLDATTIALTNGLVGLRHSDATLDLAVNGAETDEAYGIVTATNTINANIKFRGNATGGNFVKDFAMIFDMTVLGIEDYTEEDMLKIIETTGYFDGTRIGQGELLPFQTDTFDIREDVTANKGLDNDLIGLESEVYSDDEYTEDKFGSFTADDIENYNTLIEIANLEYPSIGDIDVTLFNQILNSTVDSTQTNISNTWFGVNPDGLLDLNGGLYDATQQLFNIVNNHQYFMYIKLTSGTVALTNGLVGLRHSDGTLDSDINGIDTDEAYGVVIATNTILANVKYRADITAGDFIKDYVLLVDLTERGLENLTIDELLTLAREGGFDGFAQKQLQVSTIVKSYSESVIVTGSIINLKTTYTKTLSTDTIERIQQYGQVAKI